MQRLCSEDSYVILSSRYALLDTEDVKGRGKTLAIGDTWKQQMKRNLLRAENTTKLLTHRYL
jgi:hypothetical protein